VRTFQSSVLRGRPQRPSASWTRIGLPAGWAALALFLLFSAGLGVREARAQPELLVAGCVSACAGGLRFNWARTPTCAACVLAGARWFRQQFWGRDTFADYACAKAGEGC
jgi:hypothetical protein